ncbi:MAG TPA: DNA-3-methyladenine glycosylase [Bacteroidales bacterium]|jgi:DNA-3-methyladenine glycosylase|nr:DNA-3-methyladenine glycosylase [Bacteroidales bacterium]
MKGRYPTEIIIPGERLERAWFERDVLEVAPGLISKVLAISTDGGITARYLITETEAYRGEEDLACHASRGRTQRTDIMYHTGGRLYVYLVYGMYWMLNIVTGRTDDPQAVLIRGLSGCYGPGRLTRLLGIDKSFNGEDLTASRRIWVEDTGTDPVFFTGVRIGIDYAGDFWKSRPWRYYIPEESGP